MRKNTLLLIAACAGMMTQAQVLSPEAAWQRAAGNMPARVMSTTATAPRLLHTVLADNEPACYVFSASASGDGYVVLSADMSMAPVLGYSDHGVFDADQMPDNLRYWLDFYAQETAYSRSVSMPAYREAVSRSGARAEIAPMVMTKWNQTAPYNDLCPNTLNGRTVTGCVATALAQLMKYYNYPAKPQGKVSYVTSTDKISVSADFSTMTFAWDDMLNDYPYGTYGTQEQRQAVAELMFACGAAVNMDYTVNFSGAPSAKMALPMINYFDYDHGTHNFYRDLVNKDEWDTMVYDNLANCGPLIYAGIDNTNSGHAFVCDGYKDGYYHINWGWGGLSDGYYLLSGLNPMSQGVGGGSTEGIGFAYRQHAIFGAQPSKGDTPYFYMLYYYEGYTLPTKTVSLGSAIQVGGAIINGSNQVLSGGTLGLEFIDASGKSTYVRGTNLQGMPVEGGYEGNEVVLPRTLADGRYTVRPAWVYNDYVQRKVYVPYNMVQTYTAEVSNGSVTFTADANQTPELKVDKIEIVGEAYAKKMINMRLTLSNPTNTEFFGVIQSGLFAKDAKEGDKPLYKGQQVIADVDGGETCQQDYSTAFSGSEPGDYVLRIYEPKSLKWYGAGLDVTLKAAPKTVISASGFHLAGDSENVAKGAEVTFEFDLTCESGLFDGYLYVAMTRNNETTWRKTFETPYVNLKSGETVHCSVQCVLPSMFSVGSTVHAVLATTSSKKTAEILTPEVSFTIVDPSGITDVEGAAEVVSTRMYNLQGIEVAADTAAPGHYIVVSLHADGSTTATHILK